MTTLEQAARQALEALKLLPPMAWTQDTAERNASAISALSQALEQKPCNPSCAPGYCYCQEMTEQPKQEPVAYQWRTRATREGALNLDWSDWENCTKERAQDYWNCPLVHDWLYEARALYTEPPKREWVVLTKDEILAIGKELGLKCRLGGNPNIDLDYAKVIEATLKAKNT